MWLHRRSEVTRCASCGCGCKFIAHLKYGWCIAVEVSWREPRYSRNTFVSIIAVVQLLVFVLTNTIDPLSSLTSEVIITLVF